MNRVTKQWFEKANENLRLAKSILNYEEKFYDHICYNAQQCAEKTIKGYLNHNKVRFDKTHELDVLISLVRSINQDLANQLAPAVELTKFAVRIRYPEEGGEPLVVDKALAVRMIEIAEDVYESVISKI